jgi:hypothetical protein
LYISVCDDSGKQLARQSCVYHQAPYSPGRQFMVPMGRTTNELHFPILGIPETNNTLRIQLDGRSQQLYREHDIRCC